eukprot:scaffold2102_cov161-Amphora_coffeaeformis.AAC.3
MQTFPFSVVFEIEGTCSDCPSATLIFGEHEPGPNDDLTACPAESVLRCPSKDELVEAFNDAIDRLQTETGLSLIEVSTVVQSTERPKNAPTASPSSVTSAPLPVLHSVCQATGWGDPHFVTFDGLKYDCRADGEVILSQSLDLSFMIQGRFTKAGFPTVTTGIVIRVAPDLPVVQLSMATLPNANPLVAGCPIELYVDGASRFIFGGTGSKSVREGQIPTDPINGYSHINVNSIAGYASDDIEAAQFFCSTTAHSRIAHFENNDEVVRRMAFDGNQLRNDPSIWNNQCAVAEFSGHTGIIPATTDNTQWNCVVTESGGLHNFPFSGGGNTGNHWGIRGCDPDRHGVFRSECDDLNLSNCEIFHVRATEPKEHPAWGQVMTAYIFSHTPPWH